MKQIEKLRLGVTALTDQVYAGIPDKDGKSFRESVDVTSDFLKCVLDWCAKPQIISCGDKKWEVTVKEIK